MQYLFKKCKGALTEMDREEEKEKERASSDKSYLSWNVRGEKETLPLPKEMGEN